jgi:hypothetical protein
MSLLCYVLDIIFVDPHIDYIADPHVQTPQCHGTQMDLDKESRTPSGEHVYNRERVWCHTGTLITFGLDELHISHLNR